ncbi:ATP-binding protein [Inquilinus sp. Marseille-Q2685]|uniref:ATP-binding protein n=1 Tax=Inquilinus sp. Marseille-Q2685 TaxID=2866581 RepID=UPI001CE47508|nr:ATP-binding protein [Inquilinus sp. Marseille-Q2685]
MIIHLNGWPGAGKLTVARVLARKLGARLLDNHTLHNVAAALCDRGTDAYWSLYGQVRDLAYERIRVLPPDAVLVMTNAFLRETPRDVEAWGRIKDLAASRGDRLVAVTLDCDLDENVVRISGAGRADNRKLTDPEPLIAWRSEYHLIVDDAEDWMVVDNTRLAPERAADRIVAYLDGLPPSPRNPAP